MQVKIKLFGQLAAVLGAEVLLDISVSADRKSILQALAEKFPLVSDEIEKCNVALDQTYIFDEKISVSADSEIAVIPPVSGG